MSLPRYEEYKESGANWLGRVPAHWSVVQSRRYFANRNEKAVLGDRQLTASQKHGVMYQTDFMELEGQKVMQVIVGADILKHAEPDDFVISMRSFQGGIEWCGLRGSISSAYVMLVPTDAIWSPFYRFLFKSSTYIQALQATTNLVRDGQALRFSNFAQVPLPLPPVEEQQQIAAFLDRESARIDALIVEQEKLIALLAEKRQATITHAVTKGLNPDAPMKDSGVAWVGTVPEHWDVDRIKASIASARNGIWGDEPQGDESDIACVRVADFDREKLQVRHPVPTMRSVTEKERAGRLLNQGDLLLEKSGGGDSQPVGQVVMYQLETPAVCSNFVARVALKKGLSSNYWNYVHNAAYSVGVNVGSINQTSGIQNLDQDRYFNERAPFPPEDEQAAISTFLDRATMKLGDLKAASELAVVLLNERRSALIAAAVMGQIDVRHTVNQPSEEAALAA